MAVSGLITLYASKIFNDTSKQLFVKIWDIVNEKDDHVKEIIDSLDLISKVEIVESIVRDLQEDMKINHLSPNHTIELALSQLMNIIDNIHNDLNKIREGIIYHKSLWFNSFRTPAYLGIIEKIKNDKKILDSRLENLAIVTNIFRQINKITSSPIIDPN